MATVRTNLQLYDQFSGVLSGVIKSLNLTVAAMEDMQATTERAFNPAAIQAVREATRQTEAALRSLPPPIADAEAEQRRLNQALADSRGLAGSLLGHLAKIGATIGAAMSVQKVVELSDTMTSLIARLDMMNDGTQTTLELQQKIFAAAQRSRTAFLSLADSVATLGTQAADAFASNDELIKFQELLGKTFTIAGTPAAGVQSAMYQLTQAMASGVLRGEELNAVMENAMPIVRYIADYLGVSVGEIRGLAAEGKITADVVKNALFTAADDINAKFESMPLTWSGLWTRMQNQALMSLSPVLQQLNELINSDRFLQMADSVMRAFSTLAEAATIVLDAMSRVYQFIANNWPKIEWVIWAVTGALTGYALVALKAAAATKIMAVAQALWNNVLKANPLVLVIGAIAALILWLVKLYRSNDQVAAALMRAWNAVLNFMDKVPIFWAKVGYGILSAMLTVKVKTLEILENLVNGAIKAINWLIDKVNKIPGVSIQAIEQVEFSSQAAVEAEAARQAAADMIAEMEAQAAQRAAEREQRVADMLAARAAWRAEEQAALAMPDLSALTMPDLSALTEEQTALAMPDLSGLKIDSIGTVDEVGKIRDSVDISSEDLRIMRELAEMKSIQNFVTLTPTVTVNTGDINNGNGYDVDTIINRIKVVLEEEIASSAKAVFA